MTSFQAWNIALRVASICFLAVFIFPLPCLLISHIASRRGNVTKSFGSGLVKKDAASLGIASAKLSEVMIKVSPEQMKGQGQALEDRRKAAFGRVLAAYGNEEVVEGKEGEGVL